MGVIVEIGRTLDPKTRMNLMLASKLFMEAFSKEEREEFSKELASESLTSTWATLLGKATTQNYRMVFEFEQESDNGGCLVPVYIVISPGKVRFDVNFSFAKRDILERFLPGALFDVDHTFEDDDEFMEIKVSNIDRLDRNEASPKTIVRAIRMVTSGMSMLPPRAYTRHLSWLTRLRMRFTGDVTSRIQATRQYSLQPVFEKLAMYHVSAPPLCQL